MLAAIGISRFGGSSTVIGAGLGPLGNGRNPRNANSKGQVVPSAMSKAGDVLATPNELAVSEIIGAESWVATRQAKGVVQVNLLTHSQLWLCASCCFLI